MRSSARRLAWARFLDSLEEAGLPSAAAVLTLGEGSRAMAPILRARGHRVTEALGIPVASVPNGSIDLAVAAGFLEPLVWDRWALQQVNARLKIHGLLLLAARNAFSLSLLADPRYVVAKVAKQLAKLTRSLGLSSSPWVSRPGERTYTRARLRSMLEEVGLSVVRWSGIGYRGIPVPRVLCSEHVVLCRKEPPLLGHEARAFPDPAQHRVRFEAANRGFVTLRDRWVRRHPGDSYPQALDPKPYAGKTVLVLAPHPDDEIIGCGGTLLRLVAAGARVVVLHATDGSASAALDPAAHPSHRTVRLDEARAVARAAGLETIFWQEDNAAFSFKPELVERLRVTLAELKPALIFTPFVVDTHADHRTLNRILAGALEEPGVSEAEILNYEVWSLVPGNRYCIVTGVMQELERLLLLYETAMKVDNFVHLCAEKNYYNAYTLTGQPGFVEGFLGVSAQTFPRLAREADQERN